MAATPAASGIDVQWNCNAHTSLKRSIRATVALAERTISNKQTNTNQKNRINFEVTNNSLVHFPNGISEIPTKYPALLHRSRQTNGHYLNWRLM